MMLVDSITLRASPEAVFRFFDEMETHYLAWHPDHLLFRWEHGRGVALGNIFSFAERIGGKHLAKRVVFTRVIPNRHLEFAPTFWLMRLFLPRMVFRVAPESGGCRFTAEIHLRIGPLAQRAQRKELAAVREHMRVEGENLKRIVEAYGHDALSLGHQEASVRGDDVP